MFHAASRLFFLIAVILLQTDLAADDWPQWGGPRRDIVWRETGIVSSLPTTDVLPRVWSAPVGEGYSGPAVADGRVFLTDRVADAGTERVLCFDAESGSPLWQHEYPSRYTISYPAGPRVTPSVDGGRVYTIGAMGRLLCLDAASGDVLWEKDFRTDFGTQLPIWGAASAPLIDGERLIVLAGGSQTRLVVCLNKVTGDLIWNSLQDDQVGYSPPVICEFGGRRQLIIWHPEAVSSLFPETGEVIWRHPWAIRSGLTAPMPRQIGDRLFLTAFYNGPTMLKVGADSAQLLWKGTSNSERDTDGLHSIMPTPWVDQENIFGVCSYGQLRCLDTDTGERRWETREATGDGRWWNAFLIRHEDRFFLHNEQGELIIARLDEAGYHEDSRSLLVEPTRPVQRRMTIWSHPAFAMRSVFARNDRELVRVSLAAEPSAEPAAGAGR